MQPDLLNRAHAATLLQHFRSRSPLVHCMTNDVVQCFTASVLLALGASPAMVIEPDEAEQFSAIADALLINVGTLTADRAGAMRRAVISAGKADTPWTLDPVAVGGLTFRTDFCRERWTCARQPFAATLRRSSRWRGCRRAGVASTPPILSARHYLLPWRWQVRPALSWR